MPTQAYKKEQAEVQKYVTTLKVYLTILQAIPSVLFVLFAGSWSDVHGRKLLIVFSAFTYVIDNGILMLNAYLFYELKAEYLLLEVSNRTFRGKIIFDVEGFVSFVLKFALPPFSPPLPSVVQF